MIVRVLPPDMLGRMLVSPDPIVEEFALIMLRLAVCGGVPQELVPVLQFLFTQFFEPRTFIECLPVAKVFLELLPTVHPDTLDELLSTGMPNVGYVRGHLTDSEEIHFAAGLEMIEEAFPDEDCGEPKPLLNNLPVTIGETSDPEDGPEDEIPPCEIQVQPVFFALDQFACAWQKREDVALLIQRVFSPLDISLMLKSEYGPAIEFGLITLRLAVSNEVNDDALDCMEFVFVEVFPKAPPVVRLYIAKIFLTIALNMGASMYLSWVPMEMAEPVRDCIAENLTDLEEEHYATAIGILQELLRRRGLEGEKEGQTYDELSD
jgi:hypothetical protein